MATNSEKLGELSLKISPRNLPFDLVGPEMRLGPDDWAWLFLRLNKKYRAEFANAQAQQLKDGNRNPPEQFGLISWIDPKHLRLPDRNFATTWFQPLIEPVEATEWDADAFSDQISPQSPHFSLQVATLPNDLPLTEGIASTVVWYAIDCSLPADGQLKFVQDSAKYYRSWFKDHGIAKSPRHLDVCRSPIPLDYCRYFDAQGFDFAAGLKVGVPDSSVYWRAICIDVFDSIAPQLAEYRKELNAIYRGYLPDETVEKPLLERLRFFFPDLAVDYGENDMDGFPLKALVLVAELSLNELSDQQIAAFITENSSYKNLTDAPGKNWVSDLCQRIPIYRQHATKFVDGGYRWLVRAQKP